MQSIFNADGPELISTHICEVRLRNGNFVLFCRSCNRVVNEEIPYPIRWDDLSKLELDHQKYILTNKGKSRG